MSGKLAVKVRLVQQYFESFYVHSKFLYCLHCCETFLFSDSVVWLSLSKLFRHIRYRNLIYLLCRCLTLYGCRKSHFRAQTTWSRTNRVVALGTVKAVLTLDASSSGTCQNVSFKSSPRETIENPLDKWQRISVLLFIKRLLDGGGEWKVPSLNRLNRWDVSLDLYELSHPPQRRENYSTVQYSWCWLTFLTLSFEQTEDANLRTKWAPMYKFCVNDSIGKYYIDSVLSQNVMSSVTPFTLEWLVPSVVLRSMRNLSHLSHLPFAVSCATA